jgi:hypothetical protein
MLSWTVLLSPGFDSWVGNCKKIINKINRLVAFFWWGRGDCHRVHQLELLKVTAPHVASYVDRILRGAKISDLPVEFPAKFKLVIKVKAARAIGLAIVESLLLRAGRGN